MNNVAGINLMYFHIAGGVFQGKFLESGKLDQSECTVIFVTHYQIPCIRVLPFAFSAEIHKSDFLLSFLYQYLLKDFPNNNAFNYLLDIFL